MDHQPHNPRLMRMGVMTALAIGIHNFPEGIATFTSAVDNMAPVSYTHLCIAGISK